MTQAERMVLRQLDIQSPSHISDFYRLGNEKDIATALVTLDMNDTIAAMHGRRYRLVNELTEAESLAIWAN